VVQQILVSWRFQGGAIQELRLPPPKSAWALRKTKPEIVAEIERLLEGLPESEIAKGLNEEGWHFSNGCPFRRHTVNRLRRAYRLKNRRQRLREQG